MHDQTGDSDESNAAENVWCDKHNGKNNSAQPDFNLSQWASASAPTGLHRGV